eukprot:SAG31_NODE_4567_length_3129_cov_33.878218_1_plen_31_part_10
MKTHMKVTAAVLTVLRQSHGYFVLVLGVVLE